jgi:uncharacterized protein (TIGR00159 family)
MNGFIEINFLDVIEIFLVAILLFQLYKLIKGTVALSITIGLILIYISWLVVKVLKMELLESILNQFIGVGILALIIVFHPEIRKFLVYIGSNYNVNRMLSLDKVFGVQKEKTINREHIENIAEACSVMSENEIGALIVIAGSSELAEQINSGEKINSRISSLLIRNIFFKNSPLHDGAMIVKGNRIVAAGCILPLTEKTDLDKKLGLRHRAAIGISESTDAIAIVVSEERGSISVARKGNIIQWLSKEDLTSYLEENLINME